MYASGTKCFNRVERRHQCVLLTTGSDHDVESGRKSLNRRRIFNGNVQTVIPSSSRYIARITPVVVFTLMFWIGQPTIVIFVLWVKVDAVGIVQDSRLFCQRSRFEYGF